MPIRRSDWADIWLEVAAAVAKRSSCTRSAVGAVVVDGNWNTYVGYNGPPSRATNCNEGGCPRGRLSFKDLPSGHPFETPEGHCTAVHAEMNALGKFLASKVLVSEDTALYSTREPCEVCWREILAAGFTEGQVFWSR
jgi:dCMP deaminase